MMDVDQDHRLAVARPSACLFCGKPFVSVTTLLWWQRCDQSFQVSFGFYDPHVEILHRVLSEERTNVGQVTRLGR